MKYIKFFTYQFILIGCLFYLNIDSDQYLSRPFSKIDIIGLVLCILQIPILILIYKVFSRFSSINRLVRILLLILAFLLSIIFIGMILGEVLPDIFN